MLDPLGRLDGGAEAGKVGVPDSVGRLSAGTEVGKVGVPATGNDEGEVVGQVKGAGEVGVTNQVVGVLAADAPVSTKMSF